MTFPDILRWRVVNTVADLTWYVSDARGGEKADVKLADRTQQYQLCLVLIVLTIARLAGRLRGSDRPTAQAVFVCQPRTSRVEKGRIPERSPELNLRETEGC